VARQAREPWAELFQNGVCEKAPQVYYGNTFVNQRAPRAGPVLAYKHRKHEQGSQSDEQVFIEEQRPLQPNVQNQEGEQAQPGNDETRLFKSPLSRPDAITQQQRAFHEPAQREVRDVQLQRDDENRVSKTRDIEKRLAGEFSLQPGPHGPGREHVDDAENDRQKPRFIPKSECGKGQKHHGRTENRVQYQQHVVRTLELYSGPPAAYQRQGVIDDKAEEGIGDGEISRAFLPG
jgi:hypothetical protein